MRFIPWLVLVFLSCANLPAQQFTVEGRTYNFLAPRDTTDTERLPLVILLHGFGLTGLSQDNYLGISRVLEEKRFLYAFPDGLVAKDGRRYWNATDACCDFDGKKPDDVAFISALIDDVESRHRVDRSRIFVVGHSNGGFMGLRLACELDARVAAVVSLAGAAWQDTTRCQPGQPVSVLQLHGTADDVIKYDGGKTDVGGEYPGAVVTTDTFARLNGCTETRESAGDDLNLDNAAAGNETVRERYPTCRTGGDVELWTMKEASHAPMVTPDFAATVVDWLFAHAR